MTLDPLIADLVLLSLALLFAVSGASKLSDLRGFRGVLAAYRLLPGGRRVLALASWFLSLLEICAALLMIGAIVAGRLPLPGAVAGGLAALLLTVYASAMAVNLMRGHARIDCGCFGFGARARRIRWAMVGRNLLLAGIAFWASIPSKTVRPFGWLDVFTLLAATAAFMMLYAAIETAFANQDAMQELGERR